MDDDEEMPAGQHVFDLDEAPSDGDSDMMDDEFDLEDEEDMDNDEVDSAFASSNEDGDVAMDDDLPPPHLRPNPIPGSDDEGGAITTNLEDDLDNDGFTLPAVDRGGEEEEVEHGTSLRGVETRMRWLVGVCSAKDEKTSKGIPGK